MGSWLQCCRCGQRCAIGPYFAGCPSCRVAPLEVHYDVSRCVPDASRPGIWRWADLLPSAEKPVSLGEGGTPLLRMNWERTPALWVKNETGNPTWSFKDRFNAVSISMARHFGMRQVVATTTGNHGMSAAAYAANARLESAIYPHPQAPAVQVAMMKRYGAAVHDAEDRAGAVRRLVEGGDWFPSTSLCPRDGYSNPYGVEGYKTIAFELVEQLGRAPDCVFMPLGGGDGLYGIWKGFRELCGLGAIERIPRLIGCQASGAAPYVAAMDTKAARLERVRDAHSAALSIAEAIGGEHALHALQASGGSAWASTEIEIAEAARWLAARGIGAELSSAAAVAACLAIPEASAGGTIWVAILTGAAVKWPGQL